MVAMAVEEEEEEEKKKINGYKNTIIIGIPTIWLCAE